MEFLVPEKSGGVEDDLQALFFFHLRVLSFKVLEVYACVRVCVLHATVTLWRSDDNFVELILCPPPLCKFWDQTLVLRCAPPAPLPTGPSCWTFSCILLFSGVILGCQDLCALWHGIHSS